VSKHGDRLLAPDAVTAVRDTLLLLATVVTPNLPEAAALVGFPVTDRDGMEAAARALVELGPDVALVKGGHLGGEWSPDCLVVAGADEAVWLEAPRIPGRHTHGTGCVLSAAICAELARGMEPADACVAAKRFVEGAIAAGLPLGSGVGPVNPAWRQ
jgi:hydroxymethylpyrimidine/phosphomethylpyrimidine kinase